MTMFLKKKKSIKRSVCSAAGLALALVFLTAAVAGAKTTAGTNTGNDKTAAKTAAKTASGKTAAKTASGKTAKKTAVKAKPKAAWYTKNDYYFCKNAKGKKYKGLQKIDNQTYLFDSKGRQQTGWRVIGGKYCFFRKKNGKKGYMVKKEKVNGIWIKGSGYAKVTSGNKWKISLMAEYQELLDTLVKPAMPKKEQLKAAFNFAKHKTEASFGTLQKAEYGDNWYLHYAEFFLNNDRADCYTRGCGFAFLANAIGYSEVRCAAAWGHGFCEINNRVFDPSFAKPYPDTEFPFFNGSYKAYSAWADYPFKILI